MLCFAPLPNFPVYKCIVKQHSEKAIERFFPKKPAQGLDGMFTLEDFNRADRIPPVPVFAQQPEEAESYRSEEHTSELQSR